MGEYYEPYVRSYERDSKYPHPPSQYHPHSHHAQYPPPPMAPPPYGPPGGWGGERVSPALTVVIVVVIVMVLIVPMAVVYLWFSPPDHDEGVTLLNLSGMIEVDNYAGTINVSLSHNGGDPIRWSEVVVTVGGIATTGYPVNPVTDRTATTTSVGETAMWILSNHAGTYVVGNQYTIKVITIQDKSIAWQKDITAIYT